MALMSLRNDPLGGLLDLQSTLGRLLGSPAPWSFGPSSASVFPAINAFTDADGALIVRAEAPGVDPAKLDIRVEAQRLTIAGERMRDAAEGDDGFHRRERRFGHFSRAVQLPSDLDPGKTSASYKDGILTIRIEKAEAAKARRIEITS